MTSISTRYFDSPMSGAPVMSGSADAALGVLDAFLITGFGTVTLTSLSVSSEVATAIVDAGHNFTAEGNTGPVIEIAGVTNLTDLNADWRVTIASATQFTFACPGVSDGTATGTVTAKRAPARGWEVAFSGTSKKAYHQTDAASQGRYLRVDDSGTTVAQAVMYESMTDIDTGSGPAPPSGTGYLGKSNTATSTARAWRAYADERAFYLFVDATGAGNWAAANFFGDPIEYESTDQYCACFCSTGGTGNYTTQLGYVANVSNFWIARSYTQLGAAVGGARFSHRLFTTYLGDPGYVSQSDPSPNDHNTHAWPVELWEGTAGVARGLMPGLFALLHYPSSSDGGLRENAPGFNGRTFKVQDGYWGNSTLLIDLTGPWRE